MEKYMIPFLSKTSHNVYVTQKVKSTNYVKFIFEDFDDEFIAPSIFNIQVH